MRRRYIDSPRHTLEVDFISYQDELAEQIGVKPNFFKMAVTDPKLFWALFAGPSLPYQYRLQGLHSWPGARDAILTYKERLVTPLQKPGQNYVTKNKCLLTTGNGPKPKTPALEPKQLPSPVSEDLKSALYSLDKKLGFAFIFINVLAIALYYTMLHQRRKLRNLIHFVRFHPNSLRSYLNKNYTCFKTLIVVSAYVLPVFLASVLAYLTRDAEGITDFWTLGYYVESKSHQILINFVGSYVCYSVYVTYPCLFALSMLVLIHRCGIFLFKFNNDLKNIDFNVFSAKCSEFANDYNLIEEKTRLLRDVFSTPLFIILLSSFFNLYSALSISLRQEVSMYLIVDISSSVFTGVFVITSLTICNSKIPEYMLEIKTTIGSLIDKHKFDNLINRKEIDVLERMEKKDITYMSAWGMVNFRRSFLLTSFGALFTYGLLLVNLK
ncbi:uncharacterized protein TNIN_13861 [Trichonephila inaurata madagascariensis]|uniref:Flavin-containing monooxygenase n=1 Tax=Trichonephila inaurata madagascariensis TaxID=2747483 RepID=A0A8X6WVJ4_9ARAC|nr:uncharacterized protein TNIN_13861 [Trichonephila inaurata madagascariensis]